jgi:hypothetical protein
MQRKLFISDMDSAINTCIFSKTGFSTSLFVKEDCEKVNVKYKHSFLTRPFKRKSES